MLSKHQIEHQNQNIPLQVTTIKENNNKKSSFQITISISKS